MKLIVAQQNIIVVHIIVGVYPMSEQQFVTPRIHVMGCGIEMGLGTIVCMSIGNHCCAQLVFSIEIYYVLNCTLFVCSMGKYFGCSMGSYVLNWTLCAQLDIIGVLNGKL